MRNSTSAQFTNFVYNPKDGMVYGHGVTPGPKGKYWVRTLLKMDPATLKVELLDSGLAVLTTDDGENLTLDEENQVLIWATDLYKDTVQHHGEGPCPVHLARLSLADPSVVNTSIVLCPSWQCPECNFNTTCPATLNYA